MLGKLNDDFTVILKHENGVEGIAKLDSDYKKRLLNGYFIKNDMDLGVIYVAITGKEEYFITKIQSKNNDFVIKLKPEEIKNIKIAKFAHLVQLVRTPRWHRGGRRFEFYSGYQFTKNCLTLI